MFCHCTKSEKLRYFFVKKNDKRTQPPIKMFLVCFIYGSSLGSFTLKQLLQAICLWRQSALHLQSHCTRHAFNGHC